VELFIITLSVILIGINADKFLPFHGNQIDELEEILEFLSPDTIYGGDTSTSPSEPGPSPSASPAAAGSSMENIISALGKATNPWTRLVDGFKSGKSEEIKEIIYGKGFTQFDASAQMQVTKGLNPAKLEDFLKHMMERIETPEGKKK